MFIFNGKSNCCNSTFTHVHFTLLLAQNIEQVDKLFSNCRISIFLAMLAEILVQIR